jgi:DNA repair exonuclease SbcCD ATPase subunit
MEHGKNMDYAEEIKALKKALAERDAIIAKQKRDYDALEAKFRRLQEKLEEKVKELEAIQEKRRVERARIFVPKTETMKDEPEEQVVNEAEGCRREEREANRYIQQWEKEKISIENGRWGPFIKFGKGMFKIPKKEDGSKYEAEELQTVSLDEVKKWITDQDKTAFAEKKKPAAKKTVAKKPATKKK